MALSPGDRLGPYEVLALLAAGGMGEVYRARDPRLDRDVAAKVLPEDVAHDSERLRRFEKEARAAGALNHPNVLAVYDVGTHESRPYLVTELLEGDTLRERLTQAALSAEKAVEYAVQIARGLAAAHDKGIVHRDLKPENLFVTKDGLVKILDFGLAKLRGPQGQPHGSGDDLETASRTTDPGAVIGTAGYMSPEQVRGRAVDHRSDVFSFGAVLYEMLSGQRAFRGDSGIEVLNAILKEEPRDIGPAESGLPPQLTRVLKRCLEKRREDRFQSARDLAFGLEAVATDELRRVKTLPRPEIPGERPPYPGLAAFTEGDAEHFFGREAEVEGLWTKVRRLKLVGLIGPSGAGKTSFLRAGLLPSRPEGWAAIVCTPGRRPLMGLARALAPNVAGDSEAVEKLLRFEDPEVALGSVTHWRRAHGDALVVVDQLEELFALNPPEVQESFAGLLGRLASEADVHVLLSMRDDFLFRCHDHGALGPVFAELTPLGPPAGAALRRALLEPAQQHGFQFENDALVEEMLSEVAEERGALPLLAFSVSRLWERRDRNKKLLTREAYEEIGGVSGALAQHAEATMDRIGSARQGLVREIFRNLVTAQGTRAVMDREELLSAFPDRGAAKEVLGQLIDARLLTSYEVRETDRRPERVGSRARAEDLADGRPEGSSALERSHQRIEVVHESLLKAWPRLVRWQAQDEEGALLRDQLKQAAYLWEEKERTPDLLWSGTAFKEFELWRERYPGKLTAPEEDFSRSMVDRARRRKRIRRWAAATLIVVLAAVATTIGVSHQRAVDSTRRAEASQLLALAQARLEDDPSEALALITASLELLDTRQARVSAMRALWEAPPALELTGGVSSVQVPAFSPDGQWLAAAGHSEVVAVWAETGERRGLLPGHQVTPRAPNVARWSAAGFLVTGHPAVGERTHIWSLPTLERLRTIEFGDPTWWQLGSEYLFAETPEKPPEPGREIYHLRSWRLPDGEAQELGRVNVTALGASFSLFDPNGAGWLHGKDGTVYLRSLPVDGRADRVVGRLGSALERFDFLSPGKVVFVEESGRFHICCPSSNGQPTLVRSFRKPETAPGDVMLGPTGRWLVNNTYGDSQARLWSATAWPVAQPLALRRTGSWYGAYTAFHPSADWLVASTARHTRLTFWPLRRPYPATVDGYSAVVRPLVFTPDSRSLFTSWANIENRLRLWPVGQDEQSGPRLLELPEQGHWAGASFAPDGRYVFVAGNMDRAWIVPLDGSPARRLEGFSDDTLLYAAAVSPSGRQVATAYGFGGGEKTLRVWDLDAGKLRRFDLPEEALFTPSSGETDSGQSGYERGIFDLAFVGEGTVVSGGDGGVRRWNLADGTHDRVFAARPGHSVRMRLGPGGRSALVRQWSEKESECLPIELVELSTGTAESLPAFGDCVTHSALALDASGTVAATGDQDGLVRVGRLEAGEPHLLAGHAGTVSSVAISPDLRWVASAGEDNTLRLWPMPDLHSPPLHTLPHEDLLAKLKTLTNLRAVRDPESPSAWTIELDPFPGWKHVPTW